MRRARSRIPIPLAIALSVAIETGQPRALCRNAAGEPFQASTPHGEAGSVLIKEP